MKKLMLFIIPMFLIGFTSFSCNNDDDSGNQVDVIVGTWKVTDAWVDGESIYAELVLLSPCPLQNEYNFLNDYTLRIDTFEENTETGGCISGVAQNGSWSNSNNVYTVNIDGETSSSTAAFLDDNNFTTETTFGDQPITLKFTRQ